VPGRYVEQGIDFDRSLGKPDGTTLPLSEALESGTS